MRGIPLSHPDRIVFPAQGYTKLDLARYHDSIVERELPHLLRRPLTLLRCPGAIGKACYFMKHSKVWAPLALRRVRIPEKTKLGEYLIADTPEAVIALAQMDVIEIHTWNTRDDDVEKPDRIVIDLDPGPDVPWREVILLDYLRNNRTNTSISAWSPRARDGAPVSMPVSWEELTPRLDPAKITVATALRRARDDPWKEYWKLKQRLSASALRAAAAL